MSGNLQRCAETRRLQAIASRWPHLQWIAAIGFLIGYSISAATSTARGSIPAPAYPAGSDRPQAPGTAPLAVPRDEPTQGGGPVPQRGSE